MTNHPLRAALIGYGFAGRCFHAPLLATTPGIELSAIGTRQPDAARARWPQTRLEPDYTALLHDSAIDLVVIATPNDSHHPLAKAALLAGKHVVVDKPFTIDLAQADELIALAGSRGLVLSVFHNRRWDGDFLSLRDCIAAGALGEVRELISRFDRFEPAPRDRWRERPGPGSGLWNDLGPHLLDQALQLFGTPQAVMADIARLRDGALADDQAQVLLIYPQRRVTLHCTRLCAQPGARFEAHGTLGSFHCHGLDIQEDQLKAGLTPLDAPWGDDARPVFQSAGAWPPAPAQPQPRRRGRYADFYAGMRDAINGVGPNPVPPAEARQVMVLLTLAARSATEGRRLAVEA